MPLISTAFSVIFRSKFNPIGNSGAMASFQGLALHHRTWESEVRKDWAL